MSSKLWFEKLKVEDHGVLFLLHKEAFPGEDVRDFSEDVAWLVRHGKHLVGFCSVGTRLGKQESFMSRSASFKNGIGVQRACIRYRLRWLKRHGYKCAVTYTSYDNFKSTANLIRCGFQFYRPEWEYAGKGYHYLIKKI